MTNVLAIRADKSAGNVDYTRDYNAVKQSTGPWKVNPKRLITDKCWVVLYRDDYPDVIATIEMPRFELGLGLRGGDGYFLDFKLATTVPNDLRFDCMPWGKRRNSLYYTTLDAIFPEDMEEDYLEMLKVEDWSNYEIFGYHIAV
jgi:hypothetical protein